MSVPIQKWGVLGTMVEEQQEFCAKSAEYLEANEVYDLMGYMLKQLIIHQPENPVKFMQDLLRSKPPLTVCIIGPPGVGRSKFCQQIATDQGVKHIHVGKLLRARKDLKDVIDSGSLVDDKIVIEVVKDELQKARTSGWVLDGFPRTKVQAQTLSLKEMGFCLDKILLLNCGEKAIRESYAEKLKCEGVNIEDQEDMIHTRLQQYQRHVISIAELFKNVIRQVEISTEEEDYRKSYDNIKSTLHVRKFANVPLRPPRICVIGACGSGRTTQCKFIAKHYGLVHIDLPPLIRQYQKASGMEVKDIPPEYLTDHELCYIVGRRLSETDCIRKGWVLDGFPKTKKQAEFLRQSHLWPSRLLYMRMSEEDIVNRLSHRRLDPITCIAYYRSPNNIAVRQRIVQADHDTPEVVKERYQMMQNNIDATMSVFPMFASVIRCDSDIESVNMIVQQRIDQALPSEIAQDHSEEQS